MGHHLALQIITMLGKFYSNLKLMNNISVPRAIECQDLFLVELIGYADASQKAYGCCIYIRVIKKNGMVASNLLCSKSRVAPLAKVLTIPQLELNSTLLLAQLASRVSKILTTRFAHSVFLYSDSQIMLSCIQSDKLKCNTYINNRIQQIVALTQKTSCFYVKSSDNPADILSRGIEPQNLQANTLWWHGPKYLLEPDYCQKIYHTNYHFYRFSDKRGNSLFF